MKREEPNDNERPWVNLSGEDTTMGDDRVRNWDGPTVNVGDSDEPGSAGGTAGQAPASNQYYSRYYGMLLEAYRAGRLEEKYESEKNELVKGWINNSDNWSPELRKIQKQKIKAIDQAYEEIKDPGRTYICAGCGTNIAPLLAQYPNMKICPVCNKNIERIKTKEEKEEEARARQRQQENAYAAEKLRLEEEIRSLKQTIANNEATSYADRVATDNLKQRLRESEEERQRLEEEKRQRDLAAWQQENERLMREQEQLRLEEEKRKREEEEKLRKEAERTRWKNDGITVVVDRTPGDSVFKKDDITIEENNNPEDTEEKKGIGKGAIAVLCIALAVGYAVWKGNDSSSVPGKNVPTATAQADNSASLQAQLEAEKSAREQAEVAKAEEERKRKEAEAKAAADAAARAEAEQALKKQQEEAAERERKEQEAKEAERQRRAEEARKKKEEQRKARQLAAQQAAAARQSTASKYQVGNYVEFGSYPYDANGTVKPIEWRVLANDGSKALLITKNGIDGVPYNKERVNITWADSSIRKWLNNEFLNKAFTPDQRSKIINSYIANKDNAKHNTRGGEDTYDKLFLLSIEEANTYFKSNDDRKAYSTPYVKRRGVFTNANYGGSCWWWLRSSGYDQYYADFVNFDGIVDSDGNIVDVGFVAVRMAFWLDLKNL